MQARAIRYVAALVLAVSPTAAVVQKASRASAAEAARADSMARGVATQLRALTAAEEAYYAQHGSYTADLAALGLYAASTARPRPVHLQVLYANGRSWAAQGMAVRDKTKSCVVYVGDPDDFPLPLRTRARRIKPKVEAQPVCDVNVS